MMDAWMTGVGGRRKPTNARRGDGSEHPPLEITTDSAGLLTNDKAENQFDKEGDIYIVL